MNVYRRLEMLYRVILAAALVVNLVLTGTAAKAQSQELTSLNSNTTPSTDPAELSASISGTVRTADDHPLPNARVEVRDVTLGVMVGYGYTGPTGAFRLQNIRKGFYEVVVTSGLFEARQQLQVESLDNAVSLRMPHTQGQTDDPVKHSVSVADLKVPDKAKNELRKAREAMSRNKLDVTREHLEKALAIYPHYPDALTLRGVLQLESGNVQGAMDDVQNAIQYDDSNALAYVVMGAAYNQNRRFDDAVRELERGISLDPASWQAYFELSKAELGKGQFDSALGHVNRAEQLVANGFGPLHLVKGHILLGMKNYAAAVPEFENYLNQEKDPKAAAEVRHTLQEVKSFAATARN